MNYSFNDDLNYITKWHGIILQSPDNILHNSSLNDF